MSQKRSSTKTASKNTPLVIEMVPVDKLIPFVLNPRTHSDNQVAQIAASIKEFDFYSPLLIDETYEIIAGHGRLLAARKLQMTELPCIVMRGLTAAQKKALVIADNQLALNASWDDEKLNNLIGQLKEMNYDLDLLGFGEKELMQLLELPPTQGFTDEDACPEIGAIAVSKLGDVWILGDHRVMCGDSIEVSDLEKLLDSSKVDLIFTDPPYGVDFKQAKVYGKSSKGPTVPRKFAPIANDELKGADLTEFIRQAMMNAYIISKQAAFYVWAPGLFGAAIFDGIVAAGWKVKSQIVWHKIPFVLGRADYHWQHEVMWYGFKEEGGHAWYGGRDKGTVWSLNRTMKSDLHPTMKPVGLAEIAIGNSSKGGDLVLDLFGGSGSTLIACEKLHRCGRLMELDPKYVDVIVKRWQEFTQREAVLSGQDTTFDELKERGR